jgi:hypothetical protein
MKTTAATASPLTPVGETMKVPDRLNLLVRYRSSGTIALATIWAAAVTLLGIFGKGETAAFALGAVIGVGVLILQLAFLLSYLPRKQHGTEVDVGISQGIKEIRNTGKLHDDKGVVSQLPEPNRRRRASPLAARKKATNDAMS